MEDSIIKLNKAVESRMAKITKTVTTKELKDIHSFVKEARELEKTLMSLGTFEPEEDTEYVGDDEEYVGTTEEEESGEMFYSAFIQACQLIKDMYILLDDEKIKETNSDWVLDEAREFMAGARELMGPRVPELPAMRVVSKPKKETKKKKEAA